MTDCSFQRRFLVDDILFASGDIRDQIAKAEILMFLGHQILGGGRPQNFDSILKTTATTEQVAKFDDDRPRDPRRLDGKKSKRIETSAVKYNGHRPASWRAAIKTVTYLNTAVVSNEYV